MSYRIQSIKFWVNPTLQYMLVIHLFFFTYLQKYHDLHIAGYYIFAMNFYFNIIIDSQEVTKIVQTGPGYPSPSFSTQLHFIKL